MTDIEAIRIAFPLTDIAGEVVKLKPAGAEYVGLCPFHEERTPSFTIYEGGHRFHCFGCGATGDVIDFVSDYYGLDFIGAVDFLNGSDFLSKPCVAPAQRFKQDRTQEAAAIWERAKPVAGSLAEAYLRRRGISIELPDSLRFDWLPIGNGPTRPALIAKVEDKDGELIGIQRTFLKEDGSAKSSIPKPKLSLGHISGGAIRLSALTSSGEVFVTEGIEDGLSLMQLGAETVWVAAGASNLPKVAFPNGVRSIIIGADNDIAGTFAADAATEAFSKLGVTVRTIYPEGGAKDFNDELRGAAND